MSKPKLKEALQDSAERNGHQPANAVANLQQTVLKDELQKRGVQIRTAKTEAPASDLRARRQARMSELRRQGKSSTEAAAQAARELGTDPNAKPATARPAQRPSESKPVAAKPTEAPASKPAEKPVEPTPATDFHQRVKQLKSQGLSQERAIVKARGEANERAAKGQSKPAEKPAIVPPTPEKHIADAKAAHAAGDQAKFAEHAGKSKLSKAEIQRQLVQAHREKGGGYTAQDEKELSGFHNPFTFKRDPKTGSYPGEVHDFLEGRAHLKRLFTLTDDSAKAGGEDAMGHLGADRYFNIAERSAQSETNAALDAARKSPDPGERFLAAVHDTMPDSESSAKGQATKLRSRAANAASPEQKKALERKADLADKRAKDAAGDAKPKEMVTPEKLTIDTAGTINGIPVRVTEDEDGTRILADGGDLPETPVDALRGPVPFDKGSLHKEEPKVPEGDFFADVKDEPELKSAAGKAAQAKEPTTMELIAQRDKAVKDGDHQAVERITAQIRGKKNFDVKQTPGSGGYTDHPATEVKPFRTSGQLDLRGNEVGELTGSQKPLFAPAHEPVKVEVPQAPRIGSVNAADPKHTAEMFPPEMKSAVGKQATAPKAHTYINGDKAEYTGNSTMMGGQKLHEVEMTEGHLKGQKRHVTSPPENPHEARDANAARNRKDWLDQQAGFKRMREAQAKSTPAKPMNAIGDRVKQIQKEARDNGGNIPFNKALAQAKSEASAPKPTSDDDISFDFYHIAPEAGATAPESSGTISGKADYTQSQIEHHQNAAKAADTAAAGMKSQAGKRAHQQLAEAHRTVAQTLKTPSMDKEAAAHFKSRAYANLENAKKGVKEAAKPAPVETMSDRDLHAEGQALYLKGEKTHTPEEKARDKAITAEMDKRNKIEAAKMAAQGLGDQNGAAQDYIKFPQTQAPYSRQAYPRKKFLSRAARELVTL